MGLLQCKFAAEKKMSLVIVTWSGLSSPPVRNYVCESHLADFGRFGLMSFFFFPLWVSFSATKKTFPCHLFTWLGLSPTDTCSGGVFPGLIRHYTVLADCCGRFGLKCLTFSAMVLLSANSPAAKTNIACNVVSRSGLSPTPRCSWLFLQVEQRRCGCRYRIWDQNKMEMHIQPSGNLTPKTRRVWFNGHALFYVA